jgi:hypothetical protein
MATEGHAARPLQTPPALVGIATPYRGITFRSRLEAQWAAFFDIVGWRWVYEPISYQGWLPDFAIEAKGSPLNTLLCEVKPAFERPEAVFAKIDAAAPAHLEVLVLGLGPFAGCGPSLGWIRERQPSASDSEWEDAVTTNIGVTCGIAHAFGSYRCRISGVPDDGGSGMWQPQLEQLEKWWGEAHEAVQWKPRAA